MEKYRLICKKEKEELLRELLSANHIALGPDSALILCEQGVDCPVEGDLIITFRPEKINSLLKFIRQESKQPLSLLMGKNEGNYVPIEINEVVYFSAYDNDTFAHTLDGRQYKIKNKLYELEAEILNSHFIRINKSEIVNIRYIVKIIPMFKGKLILKLQGYKEPVDISRSYMKDFKERIGM